MVIGTCTLVESKTFGSGAVHTRVIPTATQNLDNETIVLVHRSYRINLMGVSENGCTVYRIFPDGDFYTENDHKMVIKCLE